MAMRAEKWTRIPEIPLHEAILLGFSDYQDRVALVDAENPRKSYTYAKLQDAITSVSSRLTKLGFRKGDVLAFFAPNSTEQVIAMVACMSISVTVTGVNFNYKAYELGHQLADSQATGILTTSQHIPIIKESMADKSHKLNLKTIITIDKRMPGCVYFGDLLMDDGSSRPHSLPFNVHEDVAALMYSSGTTGLPKGVMLTHYNLVANLYQIMDPANQLEMAPDEQLVVLGLLPLFHVYGLIIAVSTLARGGKLVTISGFVPDPFLQTIQDQKITHLYLVPPIVVFLAKSPLVAKYDHSSVKMVLSGAAPLTEDSEKEFLKKFNTGNIYQGYGMTELTAAATFVPYGKSRTGSSGKIVFNTEIKIEDNGTKRVLGRGQEGEICVKGPQVMKGYLNRPDATRSTLDSDGWLHTGDIGYYDEDGYFFITGRIKELIKHKGFQVAPAELEGVIMTHPEVADAAVIGIPDQSAGELPRAFVVKKPNTSVKENDIFDFIQKRLTRHKWLTGGVQFVPGIPKTASGKIIRREVKKLMTKSKI